MKLLLKGLMLLVATCALATTWHVPEDTGSIQEAFDLLQDADTVIVAPGVYHEALWAPDSISFVMIGIFDTTKDHDEWPIIDPSLLENSYVKACLRLPYHSSAIIKNIVFRNRSPMYPRGGGAPGGIINNSLDLSLENCRFDSTYRSLAYNNNGALTVESCEFRNHVSTAISEVTSSAVTICNSSLNGYAQALLSNGHTHVEGCTFQETASEWIRVLGPDIVIRYCHFFGLPTSLYAVIWGGGTDLYGVIIEHNVFEDFFVSSTGGAVYLYNVAGLGEIQVRQNTFRQISCAGNCTAVIHVIGSNALYTISANLFENFSGETARAMCLHTIRSAVIGNTFLGSSELAPCIWARAVPGPQIRINYQSFAGTGWALHADGDITVNARFNWWGDSTGPYHATLNPNGLGATITGPVDFEHWLADSTDLDSIWDDSTVAVPDPTALLPAESRVDVFPNPFNSTASVHLTVAVPGYYRVDLYNTLGQRVSEVWSGYVASRKQIALDGHSLASGIYFINVKELSANTISQFAKVALIK